jgi:hypothetical protein
MLLIALEIRLDLALACHFRWLNFSLCLYEYRLSWPLLFEMLRSYPGLQELILLLTLVVRFFFKLRIPAVSRSKRSRADFLLQKLDPDPLGFFTTLAFRREHIDLLVWLLYVHL